MKLIISKLLSITLAASVLLVGTQTVFAFPYGGGGCFYCSPYSAGGSIITFDLNSNDDNGLPPVPFNFFPDSSGSSTGRLCFSGKLHATITQGTATGEATYELLASDDSDKGICYSNVTQTCDTISSDSIGNNCSAERCTYTVPSLGTLDQQGADLSMLLDGRFRVDTSLPATGPYAQCASNPSLNICNWEVGFAFDSNGIPTNLFPATNTLNGDPVDANVVVYTDEVCVECSPGAFGLTEGTPALNSKSNIIRACEALALKADWCNDLQSGGAGPACYTTNTEGQLTIGGMNTAVGDFQKQDVAGVTCVSDLSDLNSLDACPTEIAIAACGDGPGYITFPASYEATVCSGVDGELFTYSSAQGGGSNTVNMAAAGANPDAPGYAGDNTIPPILPTWTAIISTPDNQVNIWDFSGTDMFRVAFIHARNSDDVITGSKVRDVILGGSGADVVNGNDGNDILQGGDNADTLNGDDGNDVLIGFKCEGPNADCSLFSNNGSDGDFLNGGNGDDCLDGGRGNEVLTGGAGGDAFILFGNPDNDTITDYSGSDGDVIVDLIGGAEAVWVNGKRGAPDVCKIATGGNNATIVEGISSKIKCENISILVPGNNGVAFPEQCAGHPYTFLQH